MLRSIEAHCTPVLCEWYDYFVLNKNWYEIPNSMYLWLSDMQQFPIDFDKFKIFSFVLCQICIFFYHPFSWWMVTRARCSGVLRPGPTRPLAPSTARQYQTNPYPGSVPGSSPVRCCPRKAPPLPAPRVVLRRRSCLGGAPRAHSPTRPIPEHTLREVLQRSTCSRGRWLVVKKSPPGFGWLHVHPNQGRIASWAAYLPGSSEGEGGLG